MQIRPAQIRPAAFVVICLSLCTFFAFAATSSCWGAALVWKPLTSAPASLVQAYRADNQVSSPPPTSADVRVARFIRVMEPGQSVPLFLVDPNREGLTGSAGSPLLGYIPQGNSYREVVGIYGYWMSVASASDVKAARREAARGYVAVLKQRYGLPVLVFPASSRSIPIRSWRFDGKEYKLTK